MFQYVHSRLPLFHTHAVPGGIIGDTVKNDDNIFLACQNIFYFFPESIHMEMTVFCKESE